MSQIAYPLEIAHNSNLFAAALQSLAPNTPVPTCPGWDCDRLLWHLSEVQWFWGSILVEDLRTDADIEGLPEPDAPEDHDGLLAWFRQVSSVLSEAAENVNPSEPRWMWASAPELKTAGYIRRRQAHEALIHRVDAELTAGLAVSPISPELASDGVDEALNVMFGGVSGWEKFVPTPQFPRFLATDTGQSWTVQVVQYSGTPPGEDEATEGFQFAEPALVNAAQIEGPEPTIEIAGTAADLDLWLWGRPTFGEVTTNGGVEALAAVHAVVDRGVN